MNELTKQTDGSIVFQLHVDPHRFDRNKLHLLTKRDSTKTLIIIMRTIQFIIINCLAFHFCCFILDKCHHIIALHHHHTTNNYLFVYYVDTKRFGFNGRETNDYFHSITGLFYTQ